MLPDPDNSCAIDSTRTRGCFLTAASLYREFLAARPSSSGQDDRPLTAGTGVRFPLGVPTKSILSENSRAPVQHLANFHTAGLDNKKPGAEAAGLWETGRAGSGRNGLFSKFPSVPAKLSQKALSVRDCHYGFACTPMPHGQNAGHPNSGNKEKDGGLKWERLVICGAG